MNFGLATLRELIEDFLTDSGGRRGREREQRRQSGEFADADAAPAQATDETPTESATDDESEAEPEERSGGGLFNRGSGDDEDDIDDLFYRIEELEEELESKDSTIGTVQDSQQQVADQLEEMNDRVRQLLGVYDQVTDDVNPFTGAGEERNGFGVFGEEEATAEGMTDGGFGLDGAVESASTERADGETVSFDDLKGAIEDATEAQSGGETIEFDEDDDDTHVEVQATESVDGPSADESTASADGDAAESTDDGTDAEDDPDDVTLTTLPDTYATDIIVFEWLTHLVRTAGSAATLRAISYYAEIGWIDEEVKSHLEGVLSGPDLDLHVDPETTPEELTAEDHADSYTYIMKLQELHETKGEIDPGRPTESEVES